MTFTELSILTVVIMGEIKFLSKELFNFTMNFLSITFLRSVFKQVEVEDLIVHVVLFGGFV